MQTQHHLILTIQYNHLEAFSIPWRFFAADFSKIPKSKRLNLFEGHFPLLLEFMDRSLVLDSAFNEGKRPKSMKHIVNEAD